MPRQRIIWKYVLFFCNDGLHLSRVILCDFGGTRRAQHLGAPSPTVGFQSMPIVLQYMCTQYVSVPHPSSVCPQAWVSTAIGAPHHGKGLGAF